MGKYLGDDAKETGLKNQMSLRYVYVAKPTHYIPGQSNVLYFCHHWCDKYTYSVQAVQVLLRLVTLVQSV